MTSFNRTPLNRNVHWSFVSRVIEARSWLLFVFEWTRSHTVRILLGGL